MSTADVKLTDNEKNVLNAIHTHLTHNVLKDTMNSTWIQTLKISEMCDISIYKARYALLKLEEKGLVTRKTHTKKASLLWRPTQTPLD